MAKAKKKTVAVDIVEKSEDITPEVNDNDIIEPKVDYIQASDEIIQAIDELKKFGELKKRLQSAEDHYRDKVMNFMQLHQQLKNGAFTLATWKTHSRSFFDSSTFKEEFPDLYNSYLKENSVRVFKLH